MAKSQEEKDRRDFWGERERAGGIEGIWYRTKVQDTWQNVD